MEDFNACPYESNLHMVNVPKDRQAGIRKAYDESQGGYTTIRYLTEAEADAKILEVRQTFRKEQKADR